MNLTEQAFDAYHDTSEPESSGGTYLIIYGVLQSLFIQQDAIKNLCDALGLTYTPDPQMRIIREIRNQSSGHPTEVTRGRSRSYNHIVRISMSISTFTLVTFDENGTFTTTDVDVTDLIKSQRILVEAALENVIEKLKEEETNHRKTFRDKKIVDFFPKNLENKYQKINSVIDGKTSFDEGILITKAIIDGVKLFESELQTRGISEAYEHIIGEQIKELEYPLNQMLQYLEETTTSKMTKENAEDLSNHIRIELNILIEMAGEIDTDYSTDL